MKQNRGSNGTQRFIEKLKILKEQGIDVTKITQKDTIETLAKKSGVVISEEQAEKLGIELIDRIGKAKMNITNTYRGNGSYEMPTKEQVQILSELGVSLELLEKRNIVQEFIEKLEKLKEKGIDVSNIQKKDTIETLAQKSGIELTEEKARELGIKLNDKIGVVKYGIVYAYRGKGNYKRPTQEQAQMLQNLGISLEIRNTTQEFIEKLKILKELKVDATKIALKDTIQTLAEKSGVIITEEQAEELGMKLNDKIGQTKKGIADAWRGNGTCKKPTQEQVQELQKLGISLEKRKRTGKESIKNMEVSDKADRELQEKEKSKVEQNRGSKSTQRFIEKLKILKELKVDVTKIIQKDTIQTLAEKSGVVITEEKAEELGIKLSDKIGITKTYIARAYRGKGACKKPSQEQVQELLELGISLEARDVIQEFIEKLEILKEQGIDVTKIIQKDTIETLAEKSGVVLTEEKAEELGIELSDKIGKTKKGIADAWRGNGTWKKPTQEQAQELQKLGIRLEVRDTTQEFIEKLEILTKLGVNVAKINYRDTIKTLAKKSGVVLTEEKAEELGIELNDKIGQTRGNIANAYRGNGRGKKPTQEQVLELQKLGISLEKRKRTGKEIARASIDSIKNMEVSDKVDGELKGLVEELQNKKNNQK